MKKTQIRVIAAFLVMVISLQILPQKVYAIEWSDLFANKRRLLKIRMKEYLSQKIIQRKNYPLWAS